MQTRGVLFLAMALVAALVSALAMRFWLENQRTHLAATVAPPPPPAEVLAEVLVAANTFEPGHIMRPEDLRWQAWPIQALSGNYIRKTVPKGHDARTAAAAGTAPAAHPAPAGKAAAKPNEKQGAAKPGAKGDKQASPAEAAPAKVELEHGVADFVGSVVRQRIAQGEPILRDAVVLPGERGFLAAILTPGMRAVTVAVTATTGNGGFVFPGDYVDVLLTMSGESGTGKGTRRASETMLHRVRVLAMDQRTANPENRPAVPRTATLEVTPKQAEMIALATDMGTLSFSLRGIQDVKPPPEKPTFTLDTEVASILTPPSGTKVSGGAPMGPGPGHTVQLVRGDKVETLQFDGRGRVLPQAAASAMVDPLGAPVMSSPHGAPAGAALTAGVSAISAR